mgnify:CR=1 FL=1
MSAGRTNAVGGGGSAENTVSLKDSFEYGYSKNPIVRTEAAKFALLDINYADYHGTGYIKSGQTITLLTENSNGEVVNVGSLQLSSDGKTYTKEDAYDDAITYVMINAYG